MPCNLYTQHYITQKTMGNFNNEIGLPLTLLSFSRVLEVGVVEMGMENLGELSFLKKIRNKLLSPMSVLHILKIWAEWKILLVLKMGGLA